MNRGAKLLIVSLSLTATLSGWAWLTLTQPKVQAEVESVEYAAETASPTLSVQNRVGLASLLRANIPNIADLPVRGLREVGAPVAMPQPTSPPQASAPRERNHNSASAVNQAAPEPQPKPRPVRKTKSSK